MSLDDLVLVVSLSSLVLSLSNLLDSLSNLVWNLDSISLSDAEVCYITSTLFLEIDMLKLKFSSVLYKLAMVEMIVCGINMLNIIG
ncbi:unnamed protein product [Brassica oleracea var. botrytis]